MIKPKLECLTMIKEYVKTLPNGCNLKNAWTPMWQNMDSSVSSVTNQLQGKVIMCASCFKLKLSQCGQESNMLVC